MHETSIITPAQHNAHPQDRSDEARRSCDVEVLGAAPDPSSRDLRHARKRRALARSVGDAVGRCRREVARTCGDARHGVPPRPPRVSTCRRLARGRGGLPRRIRPGRVPETWVSRGRGQREGPERHQALAVPVPRTPPRHGHRGHVRIPPHACGRSDGVPARDALARGPGRAPPGQAGGRRRLPPAGSPGRSPCRPGHGIVSRRPATCGPTRGATRSRARTSDARRTGRGHAGCRGARSVSPSAATGGAGRTPRASARGSQASPGRGRRMRAISRGAPTRHATWRGATRCSSGSPG